MQWQNCTSEILELLLWRSELSQHSLAEDSLLNHNLQGLITLPLSCTVVHTYISPLTATIKITFVEDHYTSSTLYA